jgi:hypothetical protein
MAESVREEIITELENTLTNISNIKQVITKKSAVPELDNMDLPSAFIVIGPADKILSPNAEPVGSAIGKETWKWLVSIIIYMKYDDAEAMLKIISDALFINYKLGGHAAFSERVGDEILMIDPTDDYNALILDYNIYYRNTLGNL